jgi:arylsulfatase A-like enzyme
VRPELVSSYDLLLTLCEGADVPPPAGNLCGRSYLPLVTGKPLPKKQPWRTTVFGRYGNTELSRADRYKLVLRDGGKGPGELYDLRVDPAEKTNRYEDAQFVTVRTQLASELQGWRSHYSS